MPRKPAMTKEERKQRAKERRIARELAAPPKEREKPIEKRIIEALTAMGCLVERRGEAQGRGGKGGGAFKTGEPDLRVSCWRQTFGIEVKRDESAVVRDDQLLWYKKNSRHVPCFVVCTVQQAVDAASDQIYSIRGESKTGAWDCRVEPFHPWVKLA